MHLKLSRKVVQTSAPQPRRSGYYSTQLQDSIPYLQPIGLFIRWNVLLLLQSKAGEEYMEHPRTLSAASRNMPFGAVRNSSLASSPSIPNGDWNFVGNRGMVNIVGCQVGEQMVAARLFDFGDFNWIESIPA